MNFLTVYGAIFLGGGLGSVARFWLAGLVGSRMGVAFPYGTVLVNVTGCLIIGLFAGLSDIETRLIAHPTFRLFFMVGVCGGYTTFSSFSLQTLELIRAGQWLWAVWNVAGSVVGCLLAVGLGYVAAMMINHR